MKLNLYHKQPKPRVAYQSSKNLAEVNWLF